MKRNGIGWVIETICVPCRSGVCAILCAAILAALPCSSVKAALLGVTVQDGQTGEVLEGAFVMVGPAVGDPFEDNVRWTNSMGQAYFDDISLWQPQTVTAGAEGYGFTTLCDGALDAVTLPLFPALLDSSMAGTRTRVEGEVDNIATVNNDGNFDAAVVLPALPLSGYALQDALPFALEPETVNFPVVGDVLLINNIFMPEQVEFLFIPFSKTPYWFEVRGGRPTTFFSVAARVGIDDLVGGDPLASAVVREVGVERDVMVSGPTTLDIDSDLDLSQSLTVDLQDVPDGTIVQAASLALIESEGLELSIGYDTRGGLELRDESFTLASMNPTGDLSDATNAALGTFADSSAAVEYSSGIIDRSGFQVPYTAVLDSWMIVPDLDQFARGYHWTDPTNPGISPSPTWTRSNLGLRASDPQDSTVQVTVHWRVWAPAAPGEFLLPALPEIAPGPPGGLPDPEGTPEEDQLYWAFVAANPPGEVQLIVDDFLHGATHWTSRWVPIERQDSGIPDEGRGGRQVRLRLTPTPAQGEIRLAWDGLLAGNGILELVAPDGRLVRRFNVPLSRSGVDWNGRDQQGRPVPAGVYWAGLRRGGQLLDRQHLVWLPSSP